MAEFTVPPILQLASWPVFVLSDAGQPPFITPDEWGFFYDLPQRFYYLR